jgi:DNA-binding MarR family transcriptional regulator
LPESDHLSGSPAARDLNDARPWQTMLRLLADLDQFHAQIERVLELLPSESRALLAVWSTGGLTAGDLARRIKLSNAATTTLVDRLEHRDLVVRTRLETNKRFVVITPTPRANDRLAGIGRILQELIDRHTAVAPADAPDVGESLHLLRNLLDDAISTFRLTPVEVFPPSLDDLPIRAYRISDD